MARPSFYDEPSVSQTVTLHPATADRACVLAVRRGVSVRRFLGLIIEVVVSGQKPPVAAAACYGATQRSSTLSLLLEVAASSHGLRSPRRLPLGVSSAGLVQ